MTTSPPEGPLTPHGGSLPRQIPPDISHFTGRVDVVRLLSEAAEPGNDCAGTTCVITGMPGVGKTALAIRWAHQVAGRFPDGQLYVNLRGFDPREPLSANEALAGMLRSLGIPGADIPAAADDRSCLLRSVLSERRVLILLDNASSADQVRPLLPAAAGCVVLVTSRDALAGLVARDGAYRVELGPLNLGQSVALLHKLLGKRVTADLRSAHRLAARCCGWPLALRVAAEVAIARRDLPLSELADELTDLQRCLDALDAGGDIQTAVREVLSWSYRRLDGAAAHAFRMAGLHPGGSWGSDAGAALMGTTSTDASRMLGTLARGHLIERSGTGRFRMPALLRSYARNLADAAGEMPAAAGRLFGHYLAMANAASVMLYPGCRGRAPVAADPDVRISDASTARAWLDGERVNLTALIQEADGGLGRHVADLASALSAYLEAGGYVSEAFAIYASAERAARLAGDRHARADALIGLGTFCLQRGRYGQALTVLAEALALSRACGDPMGEACALGELGVINRRRGEHAAALEQQRRALALFGELSQPIKEAITLTRLALVERDLGDLEQAVCRNQRALALSLEAGDPYGQAYALTRLGTVEQQQEKFASAADHHRQALAVFGEYQDRVGQAEALDHLGGALYRLGEIQPARATYRAAIRLAKQTKDQYRESHARQGLAQVPV